MNFSEFNLALQAQFTKLVATEKLFTVSIESDKLWDLYISSFKPEDNPIFRNPESTSHNCNGDKHFIRRYGNIVSIVNGQVVSMWDLDMSSDNPYYNSCQALSKAIKESVITDVFLEEYNYLHIAPYEKVNKQASVFQLGYANNYRTYTEEETFDNVVAGKSYQFEHFRVFLPKQFVNFNRESIEAIKGDKRTTRQLFEKGLNIPRETLELIRDLIQQGSLLRGDMYLSKVLAFIEIKKLFESSSTDKNLWLWLNFNNPIARFANELIGTTCIELAEGKEINKVCEDFNKRVDPTNYKKAKSPITKAMYDLAEKQIKELGYENSFERRFATIDDINVSEIRHSNIDNTVEKPVGLFAKAGVPSTQFNRHKRAEFDKVETITIDKFISDILPNSTSVEVFLENRMEDHLVALFTAQDKNNKNLFKWSNPFSWTYNGNLSGKSMIKETVSSKGGKVDGVVRCSIVWNDLKQNDKSDLDLWCKQPNGQLIGYNTGYRKDSGNKLSACGGQLDLDDRGYGSDIHAENIYFISKERLLKGDYEFWVNQYNASNSRGFKAEIEIDGDTYTYVYDNPVVGNVKIGTVGFDGSNFKVTHHLPETNSNKSVWNLKTNQFHKVNLICTSPNYWGDNNVGTKEYFFMLQDCKTDTPLRAFHADQLNSELTSIRKQIDMLGNYKMAEPSDKQLAGIGFNNTTRNETVVRVKGSHQRVLKITF